MSGIRLVAGVIVMGIAVPITLFLFLRLNTFAQLFTIAATTFLAWGVTDLVSNILERPRLRDRSPAKAFKEDWEQRGL